MGEEVRQPVVTTCFTWTLKQGYMLDGFIQIMIQMESHLDFWSGLKWIWR